MKGLVAKSAKSDLSPEFASGPHDTTYFRPFLVMRMLEVGDRRALSLIAYSAQLQYSFLGSSEVSSSVFLSSDQALYFVPVVQILE